MALARAFNGEVHFCPSCGTLLPALPVAGHVFCLACRYEVRIENFSAMTTEYTVAFNKRDANENRRKKKQQGDPDQDSDDEADGPTVERRCPKCGHEKMSYAALQLRSADEGQTVFFTCLKCKYKESENS
ncbi:DNA-directed RNA polymerase I subunit RPA12-like [Tigriopus californicus]|uniref:DNA-directed RNA polymerase I subunit RPA12-like n=1 Tax=Tigriopus californicus TaxID=6832 RepID=UPI0027DA20F1|nr:DNA-directed RNA polymerase I subunit RPA12-like [Tigriopus californicus]